MIAIHVLNDNTPYLESVSIYQNPTKTTYYAGEVFEPSGMILTGTYRRNDGRSFTKIIQDCMYNQSTFPTIDVGATSVNITVFDNDDSYVVNLPITVNIDSFANCSWDVIQQVAQGGLAATAYSVGDVKTATVNGVEYNFTIIDIDHDDVATPTIYGRSKAGLTIQLGTTNGNTDPEFYSGMYTSEGTAWNEQTMRTFELANFQNLLESDVNQVIVPVLKEYDNGTEIATVTDSVFLLSVEEFLGNTTYSRSGQGDQYDYFLGKTWTSGNVYQLTRSIRTDGTTGAVALSGVTETQLTNQTGKIKPVFCI